MLTFFAPTTSSPSVHSSSPSLSYVGREHGASFTRISVGSAIGPKFFPRICTVSPDACGRFGTSARTSGGSYAKRTPSTDGDDDTPSMLTTTESRSPYPAGAVHTIR